jgi:NhaA family Na+:H+ antiporter
MSASLRRLADPFREFVRVEVAGGLVLLAATIAALAWANSPWGTAYESLAGNVHAVVNDGLMTVFFFVVGLEIKRELAAGELRDPRVAMLPVIAALGGMVAPALLYILLNAGGPGAKGWGIPMATDIAFALGVVALFGGRLPVGLRMFLLSLAIADDVGAIAVIAVFYTSGVRLGWVAAAATGLALVAAFRRGRIPLAAVLPLLGTAVWFATRQSGVHPTIAGVALGLLTPAGPGTERLERALHPWTTFVVVPVFALANAGIQVNSAALGQVAGTSIGRGIVVGLVAGKLVGITTATGLLVRLGVARLPDGVRWGHLIGVAALAGIGFTVSLFITGLAFPGARGDTAKLAVLVASAFAAVLGSGLLWGACRHRTGRGSGAAAPSGTVTDS